MRIPAALAIALAAAGVLAGCSSAGAQGTPAPAATAWSAVAEAPLSERHDATVVWVDDRFIVIGGDDGPLCPPTADCAVPTGSLLRDGAAFDPVSGAWTPIADSAALVVFPSTAVIDAVLYVLTTGGYAGVPSTFLAYDGTADAWSTLPLPPDGPGRLVVAGDVLLSVPGSDEFETTVDSCFDPQSSSWHRLPDDPLGPSFDRTLVVVDGRMILTAKDLASPGADSPSLVRMAELDTKMESWTLLPDTEVIGSDPVSVGGRMVFPDPGGSDGGEVGNWGRTYPFRGYLRIGYGGMGSTAGDTRRQLMATPRGRRPRPSGRLAARPGHPHDDGDPRRALGAGLLTVHRRVPERALRVGRPGRDDGVALHPVRRRR